MSEEDVTAIISLGVNLINREEFETNLVEQLEKGLQEASSSNLSDENICKATLDDQNITDDSNEVSSQLKSNSQGSQKGVSLHPISVSSTTDVTDEFKTRTSEVENNLDAPSQSSSLKRKQNVLISIEETEKEKKVRLGEETPFGSGLSDGQNISDATPGPSKPRDALVDFNKYLQDQLKLQQQKQKGPGRKSKTQINSSKNPKSKVQNKDIDMGVIFPKKIKRKEELGLKIRNDDAVSKLRPGSSLAEKTSFYLNYSDDSEYVPSEDELDSGEEFGVVKKISKATSSRKRTSLKKSLADKSTDDEFSDECCDPEESSTTRRKATKRFKHESDDGSVRYYNKRVQEWKSKETKITGESHSFDGGFKLPIHMWNSLYKYQKVGVKWLWELHQQRCGGILGDEMGLGKTVQVINFLVGLSCSGVMFRHSEFRGLGPVLLVCPATVMHQWVKEFHKWWPPFRIVILHASGSYSGSKAGLIQMIQSAGKGVVITSYTGLVSNQNEILRANWHYVILDEGHKIRNPDAQITLVAKQVRTPHRLILSGSPLQNNLKELWSLFDFIFPGKLGTLPTFMEQFAVPITHGGYSNATEVQVAVAYKCAKALRDMINPYLLRRMKADVNDHIQLPEKSEQVLFCRMTDDQRALYKSYVESKEIFSILEGRSNLFVGLINLRKICNHPHLFDGGPKSIQKNPKFQSKIPKVKSGLETFEEEEEGSDIELEENCEFGHWTKSGKMIVVETLLKLWHKQGHKVLLFTQSRQMLCIMEKFIRECKYSYLRLDGGTSIGSRQPLIDKFNEDPEIFLFILTTRVGGLGVNLTAANRVILYDPDWNPSTDIQARERAWRIGQSRQVTIYRLILSGTIEEKMYHRQVFKQFLTNKVLKDPKQRRFFKSNDLVELFSFTEGTKGTESEAIFAGTGSKVKVSRKRTAKEPREKSSGKFKGVPSLVKQSTSKSAVDNQADLETNNSALQDEYVLRKLFSKSKVQAALRHDKIVETNDPDYMILEKEAEGVAKRAVESLKRSREECWDAESGNVNWTGAQGQLRDQLTEKPKPKLRFGSKKSQTVVQPKDDPPLPAESDYFKGKTLEEEERSGAPLLSSSDLLSLIKKRKSMIPLSNDDSGTASTESVSSEQLELLQEIREFVAFQAMIDGQATTDELVEKFGPRLPAAQSPLFKQMLEQLCNFRKVEGKGVWRLKPEFR